MNTNVDTNISSQMLLKALWKQPKTENNPNIHELVMGKPTMV